MLLPLLLKILMIDWALREGFAEAFEVGLCVGESKSLISCRDESSRSSSSRRRLVSAPSFPVWERGGWECGEATEGDTAQVLVIFPSLLLLTALKRIRSDVKIHQFERRNSKSPNPFPGFRPKNEINREKEEQNYEKP